MVQVIKPKWLEEERKGLAIIVDAINAELGKNPNMSLAEFAKNLDNVLVEESYQRIHSVVQSQFDKE